LTTVSEELDVEEPISFTINPEVKKKDYLKLFTPLAHILTYTTPRNDKSNSNHY
jgi:hypothetical protein